MGMLLRRHVNKPSEAPKADKPEETAEIKKAVRNGSKRGKNKGTDSATA